MKEKLLEITRMVRGSNRLLILSGAVLFSVVAVPMVYILLAENQEATVSESAATIAQNETDPRIAVVGDESAADAVNTGPNNSWPGELVSSEIAQIQPQREGVIAEWRVRVGERVSVGDILGKISAPPATPELIKMLAEQTEALALSRAQARVADEYTEKELARLGGLRDSISNNPNANAGLTFTALQNLRDIADIKKRALRSFVERALANHVVIVTNFNDWRYVRYGGLSGYGASNQSIQNAYEVALIALVGALKSVDDLSLETATAYFDLSVRLANATLDEGLSGFRATAAADQKEFLEFVAEYTDAQAEVADKETEYKLMISEKSAMLEKDRSMARAEAQAAETAYNTVLGEIRGGVYIRAPRAGSVSAIYKKVGDLVGPEMPVAVIAGNGTGDIVVRMRIPSNTRKPSMGATVSVVRPGFPSEVHKARMLGVGASLDETGSYMADALLLDRVDWPVGASVRVIAPDDFAVPTIPLSSVWWDEEGLPQVWMVSDASRIFKKKITLGRTLGTSIEVYEGLKNGDRYVLRPTADMKEDALLEETTHDTLDNGKAPERNGHGSMEGMNM